MAITLSPKAADRVRSFMSHQPDQIGLRLGIEESGCSGFAYVVGLADEVKAEDQVFETEGIKVIVDPPALAVVDGTHIDLVTEGLNKVFAFDNPNLEDQCGCGESFTVKAKS